MTRPGLPGTGGGGLLEQGAPLLDHLEELRLRIIYMLVYLAVGMSAAWFLVPTILRLLREPLVHTELFREGKVQLVATQLSEQLLMSFNIAFWAGLGLALPFILHQIWLFVSPGLYAHERRWAAPFIIGAGLSFLIGVLFCYFVIIPPMVNFLVNFLGGTVAALYSVGTYVGQLTTLMVVFGLCFELPILMVLLTKIGIVNHVMLAKARKIALMVALIAGAVITPTTDPVNMMLTAGPLYLLYELGVLLSRVFRNKPQEQELGGGDPFAGA